MNSTHRAELEADRKAEAAAQYINPWDEPVTGLLSSCCQAGLKFEFWDNGTDQETGYHDSGERTVCVQCGDESEPMAEVVVVRKPVSRQQGELFAEVA